ncbi:hypothetical protein BJV38_002895 [Clostridium beijerinckii]|uniref:hypothetical protein n=1 Tax=Clostridium beijerinckii TaxID=1520 RepID=UPI00156E5E71|nr:hypothetical protein [Clostridium beijerinckii]NRT34517.1 hypothetical protein [Clostridium beijerinckii]NRT46052.1 hypothetical protein [Clostridium beijerinckii]NRZ19946.1 hypothetical protein [Clostridium beijerinckii]
MGYGTKVKMEMNNCSFLYGGTDGICPYHTRSCNKPCDKYSPVGDGSKEIFHDWNNGIEKLKLELRLKYFCTTEKLDPKLKEKQEPKEEKFDVDDFLGE